MSSSNEPVELSSMATAYLDDLENLVRRRCHENMEMGSAIFTHNARESCWSEIWLGDVGRPSLVGQVANLLELHKSQAKIALVRWTSSLDIAPTLEEFYWVCEMKFSIDGLDSGLIEYIVCSPDYYLSYAKMSRARMLNLVAPTCITQCC